MRQVLPGTVAAHGMALGRARLVQASRYAVDTRPLEENEIVGELRDELVAWLRAWGARAIEGGLDDDERIARMDAVILHPAGRKAAASCAAFCQCVVATRPSSRPAWPSTNAPVQIDP